MTGEEHVEDTSASKGDLDTVIREDSIAASLTVSFIHTSVIWRSMMGCFDCCRMLCPAAVADGQYTYEYGGRTISYLTTRTPGWICPPTSFYFARLPLTPLGNAHIEHLTFPCGIGTIQKPLLMVHEFSRMAVLILYHFLAAIRKLGMFEMAFRVASQFSWGTYNFIRLIGNGCLSESIVLRRASSAVRITSIQIPARAQKLCM